MERVNVLWTGGFDSSYRVCQLSLLNLEIQPFYISLRSRKSEQYELKAIADITGVLSSSKEKKCRLLPLIKINQDDVLPDEQVADSFYVLHKEYAIGTQYDLLARFAKQNNLILEVGWEYDPHSKLDACMAKFGTFKKFALPISGGGNIEYVELDRNQSSKDLVTIYGNFRFGLPLFNLTKMQTMEAYKDIGYEHVIPMTWFCAHPIKGKPCGLCHPCEGVMKANMGFRLPLRSRLLYKIFKTNPFGRSIDYRLKAIYNNHWREKNRNRHTLQ